MPNFHERFARQYRLKLPPEFPVASLRSGIDHHLSGLNTYARAQESLAVDNLNQHLISLRIQFWDFILAYGDNSLVRVSRRVLSAGINIRVVTLYVRIPSLKLPRLWFQVFSISWRSAFQFSFTVLVRYRPFTYTKILMEITTVRVPLTRNVTLLISMFHMEYHCYGTLIHYSGQHHLPRSNPSMRISIWCTILERLTCRSNPFSLAASKGFPFGFCSSTY